MTKIVAKDDLGRWSWEKKVAVATKYNQLGNMRLVSELEEVPYDTLLQWKQSEWWPTMMAELKKAKQLTTNNKLGDIVDRSLVIIKDRLEEGDQVWNAKTCELIRVPISLKDATKVANDLLDKQIKMEEMIARIDVQKESVQDTLKLLATEFTKWANKAKKQDAIDVEFKEINNAIHEEREEGLQEGSSSVHLEAGGQEEAS